MSKSQYILEPRSFYSTIQSSTGHSDGKDDEEIWNALFHSRHGTLAVI
jgi:hypothetical protein